MTAAAAALSLVVLAYARLLPAGRWQDDEYLLIATVRHWGWTAFPARLLYSPRPFSELLLALYARAVLSAEQSLILPFLACLWSGLLLAVVLSIRAALPRQPRRGLVALVAGLALAVHWLTSYALTEMFFWPMAAAAYLPVLAAASALLFAAAGRGRRNAPLTGTALLVAASTSEIGAALAIAFAGCAFLVERGNGSARGGWRTHAWWFGPGLAGLAVMVALLCYRAGVAEPLARGAAYTGHPAASLAASAAELLRELFAPGSLLLTRICLAVGIAGLLRCAGLRADAAWTAAVAVALITAAFFSLAAAYDHYGSLCCERQQTLRGCFFDLAFTAAALGLLARAGPATSGRAVLLSLGLLAVSEVQTVHGLRGVRKSDAMLHWSVDSRLRSWASGSRPGAAAMVFYLPPDTPGEIVKGVGLAPGLYRAASPSTDLVDAVGLFFNKRQIRVCQPWQTTRSWVINGTFIPACPDP